MTRAGNQALRTIGIGVETALRMAAAGHDDEAKAAVERIIVAMKADIRAVEQEDGSR